MSTRQVPARPVPASRPAFGSAPAAATFAARPEPAPAPDVVKLSRRELPALALQPRLPICTLRFPGRDADTIDLPLAQARFTIGAGTGAYSCDVVVPRHLSSAVSTRHASLERVGTGFVIRDLGSKNGTYSTLAGPRRDVFQVEPGDTFYLADVPVVVTDLTLDVLRVHLICHLGLLAHEPVEQALRDVAGGQPLLLLGPAGTGARRLAAYIHTTSPQRGNPRIVGLPPPCMIPFAQGATVYVDLDGERPLPARYAAALFDPARGLRLIFAARDERRARACLDHYRDRLRTIALVPLARRREDVPHLVQFHWATMLHSLHRVDDLGPEAARGLTAYDWPHNLDELYDHSTRIHAYHQHGGLRPAAAALGITHQTLAGHLARIGFPIVDRAEREVPLHPRSRASGERRGRGTR